jgi:mRNA-degrading endonuclease RelE of RelBE toxin-antitoxin system
MRTTVDIQDAILEQLREMADERKRPFKEILHETLQRGLASKASKPRRVRIQPFRVGIKSSYRGMSMNQLYDQLEAERASK